MASEVRRRWGDGGERQEFTLREPSSACDVAGSRGEARAGASREPAAGEQAAVAVKERPCSACAKELRAGQGPG